MKQTAAYYRSSTQLQEESVTTQQYEINQYALKKGILIDIEYPEPAVSARKNKLNERPQMKQLMTDIRIGKIGTLLVYKRDRLARKVEEHLELYKLFMRHGVDVHFIAENEPPMRFDIFGELMELFIGVMNQREGEQINLRISDTKLNNFLRGKSIGHLPFGYSTDKDKTKIIRNEDELKIIKFIFQEWNTDKYGNMEKLAQKLKEDGLKRGKNDWTRNNVSDVLTNPIYMGIRVASFDNREVSRSVEELAVITPDEFVLAQELIEDRKKPMRAKENFNYLLSELIFCDLCEQNRLNEQEISKIIMSRKPLINHKRTKNGKIIATYECKEHNIKLEQLEIENLVYRKARTFFSELLDTHFDKLYSSHLTRNLAELSKVKNSLDKELQSAEDKLTQAVNKWIKNDNDSTREKVMECSRDVKNLKEKLFEIEVKRQKFIEVPNSIKEIKDEIINEGSWGKLPFSRKCILVKDLIHEILVDNFTVRMVFKHPYLETNEVVG
ncbi:recombinase family protein [Ureibacillus manganicus]|uniref:Recombinase family protein n=1 Tax=Ureibacillus manganicus DSM 26584 TaxID=1384049 RepID=A0A0A3IFD2_9BACL|nr:recombinase family protein [Ureibacillus manganicus]KGR73572.1 hypothetical protein CD29_19630 [Ureibacillus manganicus DSM 26584]